MKDGDAERTKFGAWVLGPFETMQRQPKYQELAADWKLEQEELFFEQEVGDDQLRLFAVAVGAGHLDKHILLTALGAYEVRKQLGSNVWEQTFESTNGAVIQDPIQHQQMPSEPHPQNMLLGGEDVTELVQLLPTTKLENERLKSIYRTKSPPPPHLTLGVRGGGDGGGG